MNQFKFLLLLVVSLFFAGLSAGQTVHRVKAGESLWLIAKRAGVSVEALKQANGMTTDVVWEGADLMIPASTPATASVPSRVPVAQVDPLPPVVSRDEPKPLRPLSSEFSTKPKGAITDKGMQILQLQVTLDRAGFSPGVIDGYEGNFTALAKTLCENWKPSALLNPLPATRVVEVPASWKDYVNASLPGTGSAPDFKALTRNKQTILYYSAVEYLAERFHCSEALLRKLNPMADLTRLQGGMRLVVPNVEPFEIERYFNAKGQGVWSDRLGKGDVERTIYISAPDALLTVWEGAQIVRAYPITLNEEDSPRGRREIGSVTPGPVYARKKTSLELFAGPNSPVGIVWCPLGNGFGIHGTSNPNSIGRSVSSGCVRLANWDAVRFAGMIRKGAQVMISEREREYTKGKD